MRSDIAEAIVARLLAAFPSRYEQATFLTYSDFVTELDDERRAAEAVDHLIRNSERLPSIAAIRDGYHRLREKYAPPELGPPDLTPEERERNIREARAIVERLSRSQGRVPGPRSRPGGRRDRDAETGPENGS
jgi:hypothetical protein